MPKLLVEVLLVTAGVVVAGSAHAADTECVLVARGKTLLLANNCQTEHTLLIPDGFTLDGRGRTVTAVDPVGGSFSGAVVQSSGTEAHVRNLQIEATGLAVQCHPSAPLDTRQRGILFVAASGSIVNNQIAINQSSLGCQEGAGIEVRAGTVAPAELAHVLISGNRIEHFQKTGIAVLGPIDADLYLNRVTGEGPVASIAQNGIQLSGDVSGSVKLNRVTGTIYTGGEVSSTGILVIDTARPLSLSLNQVDEADVAVRLTRVSNAEVNANVLLSSTYDGIALDGRSGPAQHNQIVGNHIGESGVAIDLFGEGATDNLVALNHISDSGLEAIQVVLGATDNRIVKNLIDGKLDWQLGSRRLDAPLEPVALSD